MEKLSGLFTTPRHWRWARVAIFAGVILPIAVLGYLYLRETKRHLTELTVSRREAIAHLAAAVLKEKIDRIADVGVSFATRVQFRKLIEAGKWNEAIKILESAPKDFPYIDTVGLFDIGGTVRAVTPPIPEAIGQNFAYRDYYKGVSKNWQPYVSEIFKRAPEPRYNVVSMAVPIKADVPLGLEQKVLGILLLTINLDTIFDWTRDIKIGAGGFVYFVDKNGHAAGHPKFSSIEEVADLSGLEAVQKVLRGEENVETYYDAENQNILVAHAIVPNYGWGAIVEQPANAAFAARDAELRRLAFVIGIILFAAGLFTYALLGTVNVLNLYRQKEKTLLESVGDGVFAIDRYWKIILWNKAAESLTGWKASEVLGKALRDVVRFLKKADRKENVTFIEEAMLYGEKRDMANDTLLITKDGREISVGDSASPIFNEAGNVAGAIVVFRDVSSEAELQKAREEILFNTVHDLRAPSTGIKLVLEKYTEPDFLQKHPELREDVELIKEANLRMLGLIQKLLEGATEKWGMRRAEAVDIDGVIQGSLRELKPAIQQKKIKLDYSPSANLSKVSGNLNQLREVFTNLVDNAVKYNKDGGLIQITHEAAGGFLKTKIKDTGVGIPEENLAKVFTPYFRGRSAAMETQGTGLGLYIAKKLVEEMGGEISIDSQLGEWTEVAVSLPTAK